jgi:PAS domain S-box-containing protein
MNGINYRIKTESLCYRSYKHPYKVLSMQSVHILLASESEQLGSELTSRLSALKVQVQLALARTYDAFAQACASDSFQIILLDTDTFPGRAEQMLAQIRNSQSACAIYTLFEHIDEAAMAETIRLGATSFSLKSNLTGLAKQILNLQEIPAVSPAVGKTESHFHHIFRGFLEESTDSIWVKDRYGKYLLINPAGARFLSKQAEEIIGATDEAVFPADAADKIRKSDEEVMQSGITQTIEDSLITMDGKRRTFMAVKGVWRDEHGEVAGVIGTVRDITIRKQAEETLQESEERFRRLVEGVKNHAIYLLDTNGLVSSWNIGAERLQGYKATEILGCHFSRFFPPDTSLNPEAALIQAAEVGHFEQDCQQIRKDGSRYWAKIIITPLFNAQQKLIGFSAVVRDLTEQRQAEEELRHYASKLEQSNQELEQFAMIASHDLQAPLRKVRFFSEMLEQYIGEEGKDIAKRLQASAEKMQHFISDLLELSRINRKGRPFQPVALNKVVSRTLEDLELLISESGATIQMEPLGQVFGDQPQLEQLCLNLLGNSLKFRKPGIAPHIHIQGEALENGLYQLSIQDNGIGFKPEYLEKIFRPFERLHGPVQYPGTGMGLAICKKIVDRHGGQITAISQEGEGSTFILHLPIPTEVDAEESAGVPANLSTI